MKIDTVILIQNIALMVLVGLLAFWSHKEFVNLKKEDK